jgi:hypothetical protein
LIVFFILLFFPCIVFGAAWCTCIRQHNTLGTRAARPPARPPARLRVQQASCATHRVGALWQVRSRTTPRGPCAGRFSR